MQQRTPVPDLGYTAFVGDLLNLIGFLLLAPSSRTVFLPARFRQVEFWSGRLGLLAALLALLLISVYLVSQF